MVNKGGMLGRAGVTAFIATANPSRSKKFYRDTLGLPLVSDDRFAIEFDCNGVALRIQKVSELTPHPFTALGWHVQNIGDAVATLSKRGVAFERYPYLEQDPLGIWEAPSGTRVVWFKDPDGNLLSLSESPRLRKRVKSASPRCRSSALRRVRT